MLFKGVAQVGSIDYQRRWCVNGTREEYVLLDELLETVMHRAQHNATHPMLSKNLSTTERDALLSLYKKLDELFDKIPWRNDNTSIQEIVERNVPMKEIRDAANACLCAVGVTFTADELLAD